jgi:flagellar biosynthesis regulator FlbT
MALKITLKPNEKLILGGAVITNGATKCEFAHRKFGRHLESKAAY